jgi:stage II sporulation protein D
VENFDRTRTRDAAYPDNQFRNILELRYNSAKDRTWLINELSVETYLKGLGETSNISHLEFQKTLVTVARTYALYHFERATKHDDEYFHMTAYADDQVYRGYGQEKRSPRIVQSVEDTRGVVVTYDGKTAITPYFSRSDGRTRDWGEVWYGEVPWLKGVPAPCDKGKTLWGHGVGLSASEALCQANNGKEWKDILHYFYTGVDLMKRWR